MKRSRINPVSPKRAAANKESEGGEVTTSVRQKLNTILAKWEQGETPPKPDSKCVVLLHVIGTLLLISALPALLFGTMSYYVGEDGGPGSHAAWAKWLMISGGTVLSVFAVLYLTVILPYVVSTTPPGTVFKYDTNDFIV